MKNIYEVWDEFEQANNKKERMAVIAGNLSKTLHDVLLLTYHPNCNWYITELPEEYRIPDTPPGLGYASLSTELRRLYMFQKGHPTAENLSEKKRKELLIELLENLEPREAEVVIGVLQKDQHVRGLDYKFVKEAFPNMLP